MSDTERKAPSLGDRWKEEIANAKQWLATWHESGHDILKRLKDTRAKKEAGERRVNLFTADYLTRRSVLYGRTPQAMVDRRFKDPADDIARVAGEMLSRHLNDEITSGSDGYARALGYVLEDRLSVGMGHARVRYEVETEAVNEETSPQAVGGSLDVPGSVGAALQEGGGQPLSPDGATGASAGLQGLHAPSDALSPGDAGNLASTPAEPVERKVSEAAKVDYVYWEDFLWSPCRYWEVVRWVAFKAEMSRKALKKRFDPKRFPTVKVSGDTVPLDATRPKDGPDAKAERAWDRATVWEIWDKEDEKVLWCTEQGQVLDVQEDPLGLTGFFPCPRPLFSLITTDEMIPRPDYVLAQDLYVELDNLSTRMGLLRSALRVVGVYDAQNKEMLGDMLEPGGSMENKMIPVKAWAMLGENGGLAGAVDYFPIDKVAATLTALSGEYEALKQRLYEVTGTPDIMRGQGSAIQTTYGEQRIKAQFGSARLQNVQDEFARFASELQALKAEVIRNHFEPEEIIRASNMARTPDATLAQDAALFLKAKGEQFRVKVQPEALALSDFAQVKEERMEVVQALGSFIQSVTPMLQQMPAAAPVLMEILKWLVSALRGSSEIEGVLDRALAMAEQAAKQPQGEEPPPPDPKLVLEQFKAQAALQKIVAEQNARIQEIQAELAADKEREKVQREENVKEAYLKTLIEQGWKPPDGGSTPPIAPPPMLPHVP